jgi:tryptophan synthase alpha chain
MNGLERLSRVFEQARTDRRGVLMPFIVGGHPAGVSLGELLSTLESNGAGVVEVGFPFSDPIADGSVIAQAMHETLQTGYSLDTLLGQIRAARSNLRLALVAMVSVSLVHRSGGVNFITRLAEAGFDGVIVPDLTLEESEPLRQAASAAGLGFALLIAPSTPPARAAAIAQASTGFIYLLARAGITGEQKEAPQIAPRVRHLRSVTDLPLAVGFGISNAEHVSAVVRDADAAIVGSALVRRLSTSSDPLAEAAQFSRQLANGLPKT